jgi:hypothetical protein
MRTPLSAPALHCCLCSRLHQPPPCRRLTPPALCNIFRLPGTTTSLPAADPATTTASRARNRLPASTSAALSTTRPRPRANSALAPALSTTSSARREAPPAPACLRTLPHRSRNHGRSGRKPYHVEVHAVSWTNTLTPAPQSTRRDAVQLAWVFSSGHLQRLISSTSTHANISRCFGDKGDVEDITEGTGTRFSYLRLLRLLSRFQKSPRDYC